MNQRHTDRSSCVHRSKTAENLTESLHFRMALSAKIFFPDNWNQPKPTDIKVRCGFWLKVLLQHPPEPFIPIRTPPVLHRSEPA
jgi:hypothetical protein